MNRLKKEKQAMILDLIVEGNSIRGIERMTGVHRDTIMRLMRSVGENCRYYMAQCFQGIETKYIEVDEIFTYVGKRQKMLKPTDNQTELGTKYVFIAIDRETKLIPHFTIGKRDFKSAFYFMQGLKTKINGRFQLTTDKFVGYRSAVTWTFGTMIDYAMLNKAFRAEKGNKREGYSPPRLKWIDKSIVCGNPDMRKISTSFIERQNLTVRTHLKRFNRLTIAFSKKLANLKAALALHFWYYNFMRLHRSLGMTPAMAAGLSKTFLNWGEVIA